MTVRAQVYNSETPFPAGVAFELLGNGKVAAKASTDSEGLLYFAVDADDYQSLALRLVADQEPPATDQAALRSLLAPADRDA